MLTHKPHESAPQVDSAKPHGHNTLVSFKDEFQLLFAGHPVHHSRPRHTTYPYFDDVKLFDGERLVVHLQFEEAGHKGKVVFEDRGRHLKDLMSYWSAAASHLRGIDFEDSPVYQVIIAGDHMLDDIDDNRLPIAPATRKPGPVVRIAQVVGSHLPRRHVAH